MTIRKAWTQEEIASGVALYFLMSDKAHKGQHYNKAALIRLARGEDEIDPRNLESRAFGGTLSGRTKGSIEAKLMNVTAILEELGRQDVSMKEYGYVPLSNYQADLRVMVVGLLAVRDEAVSGGFDVPGAASA